MKNDIFLQNKGKSLIVILACCLLLLTSIYQQINNKQDILGQLQQGEPAATHFKEVKGAYKTYELTDEKGNFLNYAVISSASGYGGPVTLLTTVSKEGNIVNVTLLENYETPLYLSKVLGAGFTENLQGKSITQPLDTQKGVDVISGATRTSRGILLAVEKGMYQVGQNQLGLSVPTVTTFQFQWKDGLIVLLLSLAIAASARSMKKFRPWLMVASVIILGFVSNSSLTIANFIAILANKMPLFLERPIWYVLVLGVLLLTLLWGRNLYCSWLCPFGAVQEGIYKALNLMSYKPNQKIISWARKSRWIFIWLAAMLAFFFNNPGIASYEPFSVFFSGNGNTSQWIIMGLVLLLSIVIPRFWCRLFCPIGVVLDFLAQGKGKVKKFSQERKRSQGVGSGENLADYVPECVTCTRCEKKVKELETLSSFDIFVVCVIVAIGFLILGSFLQNIGLR